MNNKRLTQNNREIEVQKIVVKETKAKWQM